MDFLLVGSLLLMILTIQILKLHKANSLLLRKDNYISDLEETLNRKTSEIDHLIHLDAVTHFYKRRKLSPKIDDVIKKGSPLILYVINIKNLKSIDDNYSYRIGDIARNRVSSILKNLFIADNILFGRYYDNYYVIDFTENAIQRSDSIIHKLQETFLQFISVENYEFPLQASVGVIEYQKGMTSLDLMNRGDIAVLEIANKPDVFFIKYNQKFHDYIKTHNTLRNELAIALENNELTLYFQPQIDVKTGGLYSSEALLRWPRDNGSWISPSVFIPIAESTGLIIAIGDWVIDECCKTLKKWETSGINNSIAMNVSPKQITPELTSKLESSIKKYDIDPSKLYLEITETALWEDSQEIIDILNQVRKLGIRLALDDFGVGYSSLKHVKNLKIDKLKIDKSFVDTIDQLETTAIIKAIIELGKTLDYVIIAEGVETKEQLMTLSEMNVHRIQGWYYSKALPYDDYVNYYNQITIQAHTL